jgi:hypothetical protein
MVRLLLCLLGMITAGRPPRPASRAAADHSPGGADPGTRYADPGAPDVSRVWPGQLEAQPPGRAGADGGAGPSLVRGNGGPRRRRGRRVPLWVKGAAVAVALGLIFRRAIASVVLIALSSATHFLGINVHLPSIRFGWPWQAISTGTTTTTDLGPWVLQKIEGISKPALGQANFNFVFTHKVSKSIGPFPCWYASTFYAVGHASATVDLNPGPAWWRPASGHYRLQVLSRPHQGKPGDVAVMMALPVPQLPQSVHDVAIDNIPSTPVATQHSWTYPGLGCGVLIRPQFADSVLYAQAQQIAFYRSRHDLQIIRPLVNTAEAQAVQTVRDNFIQPTVNAFGYTLQRFTLRWTAGGNGG